MTSIRAPHCAPCAAPRGAGRELARMHGTPIYVMKDGKVVALKP